MILKDTYELSKKNKNKPQFKSLLKRIKKNL